MDQTLEENFGVKIDGNVEVDFEVFQVLVDKVGGIDLELTQAGSRLYLRTRSECSLPSASSKRLESSGRRTIWMENRHLSMHATVLLEIPIIGEQSGSRKYLWLLLPR